MLFLFSLKWADLMNFVIDFVFWQSSAQKENNFERLCDFNKHSDKKLWRNRHFDFIWAKRLLWWILVLISGKSETYLRCLDVDGTDVNWRALSLMFIGIIGVVVEAISGPEIGFNSDMSKTGTSKQVNSGGAACFSQLITHH